MLQYINVPNLKLGLALVSMCLSLIQENVRRYSSYFVKKEEEETELDVITPCKRIPNFYEKLKALNSISNKDLVRGKCQDPGHNSSNSITGDVPGMINDKFDMRSNSSDEEDESKTESAYSKNKDDREDKDESDVSSSSSDEETEDDHDGDSDEVKNSVEDIELN